MKNIEEIIAILIILVVFSPFIILLWRIALGHCY